MATKKASQTNTTGSDSDSDPDYVNADELRQPNQSQSQSDEEEDASQIKDQLQPERRQLWNVFRKQDIFVTDSIFDGFSTRVLKAAKVAAYIVLFLVVFAGTIATRGSLQILMTQYYNEIMEERSRNARTVTQDAIAWLFLMIVFIPEMFNWLRSFVKILFGERESPKVSWFLWIQIKEVVQIIGVCGLLFKVMPYLGPVEVSTFLVSVAIIPAIVQTIYIKRMARKRATLKAIISIIAILCLVASLVVSIVVNIDMTEDRIEYIVWTILSCVFLSTRWIDTYLSSGKSSGKHNTKKTEAGAAVTYLCSSSLRIIAGTIIVSQYFCRGIRGISDSFNKFMNITNNPPPQTVTTLANCTPPCTTPYPYVVWLPWQILPSFLVHFFSAYLVYHCGITACQLCMQRACFTLPLSLASPVYVILAFALSKANVEWVQSLFHGTRQDKEDSTLGIVALVVFFVGWIAQLWICRQTWSEPKDRLTFKRKLFVLPHYNSALLDLSLLHSRKRNRTTKDLNESMRRAGINKVYICATMWHENRTEMKQILKSIFRLDLDQFARKKYKEEVSKGSVDPDYYEFEAHVLFDDAMETKNNKRILNDFVEQLIEIVEEAGRAVHYRNVNMGPPTRVLTPYGGRLQWILPGHNKLIVHLKDKDKIRHKKRWSQIMYMYYLIGYNLMEKNDDRFGKNTDFENCETILDIEHIPENILKEANNTFFLALDGDVDFEPKALRLLLDRMKNPKVGATCGRIKPGGSGPVVWYQRFEYSVGHWLQKSAEHVFGCVLCSPGCFSLFRAKALMDDNVMRTYAILPTQPRHYLQYDQGEDRWLCTLLLQQGYRIEYCAAAEALTFAPEEFKEFFNQRRRWLPSTMANIMDLLESHKRTTKKNSNISYLYIVYQFILLVSSILGPSTVLIALESSISAVFDINRWVAYLIIYGPTVIFIFVCLKLKTNTQLNVAMGLSALYAMAMMGTIVGILVSIAGDGWYTPTAIFLYVLIASFLLAAFLHIHEFFDLLYGLVYFICIPAGYLFLVIYAICNLNNISWGTRETQKAVLEHQSSGRRRKAQIKEAEKEFDEVAEDVLTNVIKQVKAEKIQNMSCSDMFMSMFRWANNMLMLNSLRAMQEVLKNTDTDDVDLSASQRRISAAGKSFYGGKIPQKPLVPLMLDDTSWARKGGPAKKLTEKEDQFWRELINTYLYPLDHNEQEKKDTAERLADYRNKISFAFFFVNALWIIIMTAMNQVKNIVSVPLRVNNVEILTIEPLGFVFLVIFTILLLLQLVGMIAHRYETLLHVLSATELRSHDDPEEHRKQIKTLSSQGPDEDFIEFQDEATADTDAEENIFASRDELQEGFEDFQTSVLPNKFKKKTKKRLDLDRNYRRTVKTLKRRQTQKRNGGRQGGLQQVNSGFQGESRM